MKAMTVKLLFGVGFFSFLEKYIRIEVDTCYLHIVSKNVLV